MSEPKLFNQGQVNHLLATERRECEEKAAALQVEIGMRQASKDELTDTLAAHGVTVTDGESLTDAGNRFLAQLEADDQRRSAEHEAALAQLQSEADARLQPIQARLADVNGRLTSMTIDGAIHKAAREAGAFDADQVVALHRDKARLLPNGEVVLSGVMPMALQSPAEVCDYLKCEPTSANLFAPSGR